MPKFLDVTDLDAAKAYLNVTDANVKDFGAKGDGKQLTTASISSGSANLTVTGAGFSSADVGKVITVYGAGASGAPLNTTISTITSSTQVVLAASAATTVSSAEAVWGTDDTVAIQAALDSGRDVTFPAGIFLVSTGEVPANGIYALTTSGQNISGAGRDATTIYLRYTTEDSVCLYLSGGVLSGCTFDGGHVPVTGVVQNDLISNTLVIHSGAIARDLYVTRSRSSNIIVAGQSKVENCILDKFGDHSIYVGKTEVAAETPLTDIEIRGCIVTDSPSYHNNATYGTVRGAIKVRGNVQRVVIANNNIAGDISVFVSGTNEITEGIPKYITVTGNTLTSSYAGLQAETLDGDTPGAFRISAVTVSGNTFSGKGVVLKNSSATISGNTFQNVPLGITSAEGYDAPPWTITANTFSGCDYAIYGPIKDSLVSGNVFTSCPIGIHLNRHANLRGNVFHNSTTYAVFVAMGSSATDVAVLDGNVFAANTLALSISSVARSYAITNNTFVNNTALATVGHGSSFNALTVEGNQVLSGATWPSSSTDAVTLTRPAQITGIAPTVNGSTSKTTPVDADELALVDSAAANVLKKLTWANLKASLATYYNSLTATLTGKTISLTSNTVTGTTAEFNTALSDNDFATLSGTESLSNKTLTSPRVGTGILDTNGATVLGLSATASAVNYLYVRNASNTFPALESGGTGTNVNIMFVPKGSGNVTVYTGTGQTPTIAAAGADSNHNLNLTSKGTGVVQANGNPVGVKVAVPASASATGVLGQWAADSSYIYVCTAANTWMRAPIATW